MNKRDPFNDILLGVAAGDALGVPVEFKSRQYLTENTVIGMQGYGSHNQPPGTWSDDSSLTFCLAEMLCKGYDLDELGNRFINWKEYAHWTAHDNLFDIGIATSFAINRLASGMHPVLAGGSDEGSNGNGSLMRILPLLFYIRHKNTDQRLLIIRDVSSLTHGHIRSVLCCFIYLEFAIELLKGQSAKNAYLQTCTTVNLFLDETATCTHAERLLFNRILSGQIGEAAVSDIHSSGYVLHTLEASIWCILTTGSYQEATLKAVNLGSDTDTTGAVTGGLAGLLYGWKTIPEDWLTVLVKRQQIEDLANRLKSAFS